MAEFFDEEARAGYPFEDLMSEADPVVYSSEDGTLCLKHYPRVLKEQCQKLRNTDTFFKDFDHKNPWVTSMINGNPLPREEICYAVDRKYQLLSCSDFTPCIVTRRQLRQMPQELLAVLDAVQDHAGLEDLNFCVARKMDDGTKNINKHKELHDYQPLFKGVVYVHVGETRWYVFRHERDYGMYGECHHSRQPQFIRMEEGDVLTFPRLGMEKWLMFINKESSNCVVNGSYSLLFETLDPNAPKHDYHSSAERARLSAATPVSFEPSGPYRPPSDPYTEYNYKNSDFKRKSCNPHSYKRGYSRPYDTERKPPWK